MIDPFSEKTFPYKPLPEELREKYIEVFETEKMLRVPTLKRMFDILVSLLLIVFCMPVFFALKLAYMVEGLIDPPSKGPLLFYYWAISGGRRIKKWKLRLIKIGYVDSELARSHDWLAYAGEWNPAARTVVGRFVKKYYLDELPQFWSVFIGDMSLVGPRPLAILHYERDLMQGNVTRKILRGGLLGLGHNNKGTELMGQAEYEFMYAQMYLTKTGIQLVVEDLRIISKGILLISKGGGH